VLDGPCGYLVAVRSEADCAGGDAQPASPLRSTGPYVPERRPGPTRRRRSWADVPPRPSRTRAGDARRSETVSSTTRAACICTTSTAMPGLWSSATWSSDDMVRWRWHKTVLAPPATGHGMFSGTGFYTKDGRPAIIYHGQGAGRNVIQHRPTMRSTRGPSPWPFCPRRPTARSRTSATGTRLLADERHLLRLQRPGRTRS